MPHFTQFATATLLGICLFGFAGCTDTQTAKTASTTSQDDHDDGHDHGEDGHEHDEDGHDHGEDGHDDGKDGHDHNSAEQIDASAAGLLADDLVTIEGPEIPGNFNDAVKAFSKMATEIGEGFKNDKIDDAHGPLHDVGNFLERIEELAKESDMTESAKKSIGEAIEQLFDAFGDVDMKLHDSKKGKDYADVADDIEKALKTLSSFVKE